MSRLAYPLNSAMSNPKPPTPTIDLPIPRCTFIGRETLVEKIHKKILKTIDLIPPSINPNPLYKLTLILGEPGMGKSALAMHYAYQYKTQYKAITWIDAGSRQSIIESFLTIAQNLNLCPYILEKRSWTSCLSDLDVKCLLNCIYRHFATHHKKSLFIFDDAQQFKKVVSDDAASDIDFSLDKYLPSFHADDLHLRHLPSFLVTSSTPSKMWVDIPKKQIIEIGAFAALDASEYLVKTLGVKNDGASGFVREGISMGIAATKLTLLLVRQRLLAVPGLVISGIDLYHMNEFEESIKKLAGILNYYPLGLYLAKCKINEDWMNSGFSLLRYKVLFGLVENYLKNLMVGLEDLIGNREFEAVTTAPSGPYSDFDTIRSFHNDEILNVVLTITVKQIIETNVVDKDTNVELSKLALCLFDIISYLPAEFISIELCGLIYLDVNISNEEKDQERGQEDGQCLMENEMKSVRDAFEILHKYGIVSLSGEQKEKNVVRKGQLGGVHVIRVSKEVQKWRREYLKSVKDDCNCLKTVKRYFEVNCVNPILDSKLILSVIENDFKDLSAA